MNVFRRSGIRLSAIAGLVFLMFGTAFPANAKITYHISLADRTVHRFDVTMDINNPVTGTEVAMPAWNALYQVRDFAVRVRDVRLVPAYPIRKIDKQTWQIGDPMNPLAGNVPDDFEVHYTIEWNDLGPFNSQVDDRHAFLNLAEVLMYVPNRRPEATEVVFDDLPEGWKIATELAAGPEANSFAAPSYDALVDAPVEMGNFREASFDVNGAHYRMTLDTTPIDSETLESNLRKIVRYETTLMGGAPFKEYLFIFHIGPYGDVGGGGMEHANSTAIAVSSVPLATSIGAHEFFHVWNVKRIRPQTLEPVDYTKEEYTRALWFAEGVTNTYESFTLVRTGIWSKDQFYQDLSDQITELQSRPARLWQSAEESSLDAWFEKYDSYRAPDRSISYYDKGQILGDLLDLSVREATENKKSLDDVLRLLNEEYAKKGKYYNDSEGIEGAVEQVAGKSYADFFRKYVSGTEEIPYNDYFTFAGLSLNVDRQISPDIGFMPARVPGGKQFTVATLEHGGPAEAAGLRVGDEILTLNGEAFPHNLRAWLREQPAGAAVTLHISRGMAEMDIQFKMSSHEEDRYSLAEDGHASELQKRIREGFLKGTTD